ncbi:A/G-specific adenine glycosylase [Geofilum sp. OHC36d9]|uniref:A/G-specific adenine glycosylase n=1 Tax=Geofilum sp. OHC36d9 TaxID=3458413 RepID=UPI0040339DBE
MTEFSRTIIKWYQSNKRDLPWRKTSDPYQIWISEVILQQTQVIQGLNYYYRFLNFFPDVATLANANQQQVLKAWQGLGYYSRARNLHQAAQQVMLQFDGKIPDSKKDLLKLKGIGPYTAAAIASMAFNLPHAAIDGNAYRLLSRYFNIHTPIDTTEGKKQFETLGNQLITQNHPGDFNQAIMDLGATICLPTSPKCSDCPLYLNCQAAHNGQTINLPVKSKKTKRTRRFFNYLIILTGQEVYLTLRQSGDIWQDMYQFPLIEDTRLLSIAQLKKRLNWSYDNQRLIKKDQDIRHQLTHQELHIRFFYIITEHKSSIPSVINEQKIQFYNHDEVSHLPVPKIISDKLNHIFPKLIT